MQVPERLRAVTSRRWVRAALVAGGFVVAAALVLAAYTGVHRAEGYYGPVFAPDGGAVYFVQRNVVGIVWGLGFECFTPPAHVYTLWDRASLRRVSLDRGSRETLLTWTTSPIVRRRIDEYRGRLFGHVWTAIGFSEAGAVQVALRLDVPRVPSSEQWWAGRIWDDARHVWVEAGEWRRGYPPFAIREGAVLAGDWEVMTLRGRQALPAAVVAFNHVTRETRVLARSGEFGGLYPDGPPVAVLEQQSRRADIERVQEITRVHDALVARFRGEGLSEGAALLAAAKEMQRLGYYPKSTTLTARLIAEGPPGATPSAGSAIPTFDISDMEFTVGLFPDIDEAMASPGTAVDKHSGDYIIHRDYTTSGRINQALGAGITTFRVRARGRLYELTIERP